MRGKLWFIGGLAAGFVLGARAGRERYEELVVKGRKVLDHPTIQEAAGVAQAQANRLYAEGRDRLSQTRLGEKLNGNGRTAELGSTTDDTLAGGTVGRADPASTTGTSGSPTESATRPAGSAAKPAGAATNGTPR